MRRDDNDLLTTGPIAKILGYSSEHTRRLIDAGEIPSQRTGNGYRLVTRGDAERFAAERRRERDEQ